MLTVAAIDMHGIFPLIIGLIWVIAQIAGAAAKKKRVSPSPDQESPENPFQTNSPTEPRPVERDPWKPVWEDEPAAEPRDPFAELLRGLSGGQELKTPVPPAPEPIAKAVSPPPPAPVQQTAPSPPAPEPVDVPEVDIRPTMRSLKPAMPSMKLPAMNLSFQTSENQGSGVPKVGKIIDPGNPRTLRRAILGQIILGKPRAMEDWNTGRVE